MPKEESVLFTNDAEEKAKESEKKIDTPSDIPLPLPKREERSALLFFLKCQQTGYHLLREPVGFLLSP